jgi:DNA-binding NarL/FixJ family response regulator
MRGGGTKAARRAIRSSGSSTMCVVPSRYGGSGLEAMRRMLVHEPKLRVLIFSMHGEAIFVSRAIQAGACGYITKSSAPEVLVTVHTLCVSNRLNVGSSIGLAASATFVTESFGNAVAAADNRTLPGARSHLRLLVNGTQPAVSI